MTEIPQLIDEILSSLNGNPDTNTRLHVLRSFAEYWHGPIGPDDGFSRVELRGKPIPSPLRWWFEFAGHRTNVFSGQNRLIGPNELMIDNNGRIPFYVENQGVYLWSTTLEDDDPQVFGRFEEFDAPWTNEGIKLSEFLIGACLFQAIMSAPFGASTAWLEQPSLDKLLAHLHQLPLVPWRWPVFPSHFYAGDGALMFACPDGDNRGNKTSSVWIGSQRPDSLAFLKTAIDRDWDYVAID